MVDLLEQTHLVGGLNLERTIGAAQKFFAAAANPVLVYVGGGRATLGRRDPKTLLAGIPDSARVIGIAATEGEWPQWIVALAARPGGRAAKIGPEADIRASVIALLDTLDQPSLPGNQVVHRKPPAAAAGGVSLGRVYESLLPRTPRCRFPLSDWRPGGELIVVGWQWKSGRLVDAEERFERLLADPDAARHSPVWRLAAMLADERGQYGLAISRWERALQLEGAKSSVPVPVEAIRQDYGWLLNEYYKLAHATAGLESTASKDLVVRVMTIADRWRSLDCDPAPASYAAARALADLGAADEAWLYVTTPPEWKRLAERLEKEGYGGVTRQE